MLTNSLVGQGRLPFSDEDFSPRCRIAKPQLFALDHDSIPADIQRQQPRLALRALCAAALVFVIIMFYAKISNAQTNFIRARSAILVDLASGEVLYEQNASDLIAPASITKVLTLYLAFEAIEEGRVHWSDGVRISQNAVSAKPVRMGLKAGTVVPLQELIYGTAIVSGNDAAIAVAEHVGGSEENFVRMMNIKAKQLGMWNSNFVNPNGLPAAGQVTTAKDILKLSVAYLQRFPRCLEIHSQQKFTYNNRTRSNANRLLGACPGVDGLKTGFVNAAGYNLAATGTRGGRRLVAVVLGAASPGLRKTETTRLLEYGFEGTPLTPVIMAKESTQRPAAEATVSRGATGRSRAVKTCAVKGKRVVVQAKGSPPASSAKQAILTASLGVKPSQPKLLKTAAVANGKAGLTTNAKQSVGKAGRSDSRVQAVGNPVQTKAVQSAAAKPADSGPRKKQPEAGAAAKQKPMNKVSATAKSQSQTPEKAKPAVQCSIKKPARMAN